VRVAGVTGGIETGQLLIVKRCFVFCNYKYVSLLKLFPIVVHVFYYFVMNKNEFIQADGGLSLYPAV
jgi:hypothetical protein